MDQLRSEVKTEDAEDNEDDEAGSCKSQSTSKSTLL